MRRIAALVLGLAYLLQATWLLQGGVDLLFPRTQVVQAGATACCTNGCGCPVEARERKACCCYPNAAADATDEKPVEVRLSTIEEARCKGIQDAGTELDSLPALPGPALGPTGPVSVSIVKLIDVVPDSPISDRSPEKVPI